MGKGNFQLVKIKVKAQGRNNLGNYKEEQDKHQIDKIRFFDHVEHLVQIDLSVDKID